MTINWHAHGGMLSAGVTLGLSTDRQGCITVDVHGFECCGITSWYLEKAKVIDEATENGSNGLFPAAIRQPTILPTTGK